MKFEWISTYDAIGFCVGLDYKMKEFVFVFIFWGFKLDWYGRGE